jgi:hypothetical protein
MMKTFHSEQILQLPSTCQGKPTETDIFVVIMPSNQSYKATGTLANNILKKIFSLRKLRHRQETSYSAE